MSPNFDPGARPIAPEVRTDFRLYHDSNISTRVDIFQIPTDRFDLARIIEALMALVEKKLPDDTEIQMLEIVEEDDAPKIVLYSGTDKIRERLLSPPIDQVQTFNWGTDDDFLIEDARLGATVRIHLGGDPTINVNTDPENPAIAPYTIIDTIWTTTLPTVTE